MQLCWCKITIRMQPLKGVLQLVLTVNRKSLCNSIADIWNVKSEPSRRGKIRIKVDLVAIRQSYFLIP